MQPSEEGLDPIEFDDDDFALNRKSRFPASATAACTGWATLLRRHHLRIHLKLVVIVPGGLFFAR